MDTPQPVRAEFPKSPGQKKAWVIQRDRTAAETREKRRRDLELRAPAIREAVKAYRVLDERAGATGGDIRIRTEFIRLADDRPDADDTVPYQLRRDDDLRTRPPLTRLIHRSGSALPAYLCALYVMHLTFPPGTAVSHHIPNTYGTPTEPAWDTLMGLNGDDRPRRRRAPNSDKFQPKGNNSPRENRHRRLARVLGKLEELGLVAGTGQGRTGRFKQWIPNHESGDGFPYEVPGSRTLRKEAIALPYWFFRNGWHLVLAPTEIAVFFAIVERSQTLPRAKRRDGVALPASTRWRRLGLTDEVYLDAHNLDDFGLIEVTKPEASASAEGREPLRFHYPPQGFGHQAVAEYIIDKPALDIVLEDLADPPERLHPGPIGPRHVKRFNLAIQKKPADPAKKP